MLAAAASCVWRVCWNGPFLGTMYASAAAEGAWPPKMLIGWQPLARAVASAQTIWPFSVVALIAWL